MCKKGMTRTDERAYVLEQIHDVIAGLAETEDADSDIREIVLRLARAVLGVADLLPKD